MGVVAELKVDLSLIGFRNRGAEWGSSESHSSKCKDEDSNLHDGGLFVLLDERIHKRTHKHKAGGFYWG